MIFVFVGVDGFVYFFVVVDVVLEVECGLFWVLVLVVWISSFDILNVGYDEFFFVIFGFDKYDVDIFLVDLVEYLFLVFFGVVCCIENINYFIVFELFYYVCYGSFGCSLLFVFVFGIVGVEEVS